MKTSAKERIALLRLGRAFERAARSGDHESAGRIEKEIALIVEAHPEEWLEPLICRGQNAYRRAHGLEEVYP